MPQNILKIKTCYKNSLMNPFLVSKCLLCRKEYLNNGNNRYPHLQKTVHPNNFCMLYETQKFFNIVGNNAHETYRNTIIFVFFLLWATPLLTRNLIYYIDFLEHDFNPHTFINILKNKIKILLF